jgi:hypothetical protein
MQAGNEVMGGILVVSVLEHGASLQAELQFADLPSVHPAIGIDTDLKPAQACTQTGRNLHIHLPSMFSMF